MWSDVFAICVFAYGDTAGSSEGTLMDLVPEHVWITGTLVDLIRGHLWIAGALMDTLQEHLENQYMDTYVCRTWTLMDDRDTYGASAVELMFPVRGRG